MTEEVVEQQGQQPADEATPEEIAEAKSFGWAEKEHWRGKPEDFLGAREFLERGRHLLPVLQRTNAEHRTQIGTLRSELAVLREQTRAQQAALDLLESSREEDVQAGIEAARAELREKLAEASERGDHAAVAELTDQMTRMSAPAEKKDSPKRRASDNGAASQPQVDPRLQAEVRAWFESHSAYMTDQRRIALANAITIEKRQAGVTKVGAEFMNEVAAEVEEILGGGATPGQSKVAASRGRDGGGSGNGRSYSDLPAEAKTVCDRQAKRFVGADRRFKTIDAWRANYAATYFGQEG